MLPGFRFLFAAIALSVSILIFGLGAAALLRAAHEEFASNSSWRGTPEPPILARQPDANRQVLAMLQVEPQRPAERSEPARVTDATPDVSPALSAPAEPESVVAAPAEAEKVVSLKPQEVPLASDAATDTAKDTVKDVAKDVAKDATGSTEAEAPRNTAPVPAQESKVATVGETKQPPANASPAETDSVKSEVAKVDAAIETNTDTKVEMAITDTTSPEPTTVPAAGRSAAPKVAALPDASEDRAAARRQAADRAERIASRRAARLRAAQEERAKEHRRMAAAHRARAARQRAAAQQPQAGLGFGQSSTQTQ